MATADQQPPEQGESLQNNNKILTDQPPPNMTNRVSLAKLIELGVQRTYHELTVLAELLPRKTEIERKIEIVQFVSRTRQTFVRLLALVKWASKVEGGATKVEQCMDIVSFLDKQALLFINTADNMANIARTTLVQARLPSFQLPCAVEVLTLGTYSKMPTCIRDRIVPPDPITRQEKKSTLLKLNHIIEQRLSVSNLPVCMRNLKIEYGRVTFHVEYEFDLTLTLLGDGQNIPWKALNVDILVEDSDTCEGKDLVHGRQYLYLLQVIQARLIESSNPLQEVYVLLHSFCSNLQVEVLHDQMERLLRDRLASFIKIAEYVPGNKLAITYWKSKNLLRIETDKTDPSKPLKLLHQPELVIKEEKITESEFKPGILSIERLIAETTQERAQYKLSQIAIEIREKGLGSCKVCGTPALLYVSCLEPCRSSEELIISIDPLNGSYLAHVAQYGSNCPITENIQEALNNNRTKLKSFFNQLRIWLTKKRCNKTVEFLSITVSENLPLCTKTNQPKLDENVPRMFFQFNKYNQHYIMAEFSISEVDPCRVNIKYHLLTTETMTGDTIDRELFPDVPVESLQKDLIVAESMMELTIPYVIASSHSYNSITSDVSLNLSDSFGKRSALDINSDTISLWTKRFKRQSKSSFHVSDLPHLIGFCEEKLAYLGLSAELKRRNIEHQIERSETSGSAHSITIERFPYSSALPNGVSSAFQKDILSITVTLHEKFSKIWMATYVLANCPVNSQSLREYGNRRLIHMNYDSTVSAQKQPAKFIDDHLLDLTCAAHLYDAVKEFAHDLKTNDYLQRSITIKNFNYRRLCIAYGSTQHATKNYTVTIVWRAPDRKFHLSFGIVGGGPFNSNPHSAMTIHYKHEFNKHKSIMTLMQNLILTFGPLATLQNCTSIPLLGVVPSRPSIPILSFCIIALSTTHIRLIYRNTYCLDIKFHSSGPVLVRDGAYSRFDQTKALEDLAPIQGLKAFLSRFNLLTLDGFQEMFRTETNRPSTLERFLGCAFMKRNLLKATRTNYATKQDPRASEPPIFQFRGQSMLYRFTIDPTMESLCMKAIGMPEDNGNTNVWTYDEVDTLERYFDSKVVSFPYKPDAFISFNRLLSSIPLKLKKDFIALLRIELNPSADHGFNPYWNLSVCMTIPPGAVPISHPGMSSICIIKANTIFFFINLTMKNVLNSRPEKKAPSVYIPLLFNIEQNNLSVHLPRGPESFLNGISEYLKTICNKFRNNHLVNQPCILQSAIKELMSTPNLLELPYDPATRNIAMDMDTL